MTFKNIITREHFLKDADYMMSLAADLRNEYINYNINVLQKDPSKIRLAGEATYTNVDHLIDTPANWHSISIKYHFREMVRDADEEIREYHPTAIKLTEYYGDDCTVSGYSTIQAGTIIHRHSDIENESASSVRVHIPIIIPQGDVFLEVAGEIVKWDDIFIFHNQRAHSAWNCSDQPRVIFVIDIAPHRLGLPPGEPYDAMRDNINIAPFEHNGIFA